MKKDGAVEQVFTQLAEERKELLFRRRERRAVRFAGILLVCGALFGIDPVIDQVNLIPDFLSGICFLTFFLVLGERFRVCRFGAAIAGLYTVVSFAAHAFSLSYFSKFDILNLYAREEEAVRLYDSYLAFSLVELFFSFLLCIAIAAVLIRLVPHVAGAIGESDSIQTTRLRRSMKREAILLVFIHLLSAFSWIIYLYYSQFTKSIALDPGFAGTTGGVISSNVPLIDGLWLVPPLFSIVELFVALHLTSRFCTESELTYAEI
jgi:hypothetical protein